MTHPPSGYIPLPADDDPPRTDRVEPDRELLREARECAGLSQRALGLRLARFGPSVRVRLVHFEKGRDRTIDAELYEAVRDEVRAALDERRDDRGRVMGEMLWADEQAAGVRADLRRMRYRVEQREQTIREAEVYLARLRDGLRFAREMVRSTEGSLADLERARDEWREELRAAATA